MPLFLVFYERVPYRGFLAKYAAAFFRMSRFRGDSLVVSSSTRSLHQWFSITAALKASECLVYRGEALMYHLAAAWLTTHSASMNSTIPSNVVAESRPFWPPQV